MDISIRVLEFGKLTDWLILAVNFLAFTSGLVLLWLTRRTLEMLVVQLRTQSSHQIIEAHKTLFMPIVQNAKLAEIAMGSNATLFRRKMLASMMINHASRIYNEFSHGVRPEEEMDEFRRDLCDLFGIPIVNDRWPEVKSFHKKAFVSFVNDTISSR